MQKTIKTILLCYLLLCSSIALAANENEWTQYQANAAHTGYVPVTLGLKNVRQLWDTKIENITFYNSEPSYPIIADGMIYLSSWYGTSSAIYAFNETDGKMVWQFPIGAREDVNVLSPISYLDKNIIFEVIDGKGYPSVYKLFSHDGQVQAINRFNKTLYTYDKNVLINFTGIPNPTVSKNKAFFVTHNDELTSISDDFINTTYPLEDLKYYSFTNLTLSLSPAILNNYLVVYSEHGINMDSRPDIGTLEVFDVNTGSKFDIDNPYVKGYQSLADDANLTPVFIDSTHVGVISGATFLTVFDLVNKKISYNVGKKFQYGKFVVDADAIYAIKDFNKVVALNKNSGEVLWSWTPEDNSAFPNGNMIVTNDFLIVQACDIYIISKKTHETVKRINIDGASTDCFASSSMALANKNLYVLKNYRLPFNMARLMAFSLE